MCVFNACMPIRAQIRNYRGRIRNFVMRSEIRNNYEFFVMVGSSAIMIVSSQTLKFEMYYFIIDEYFSLNVGAMDF